MGIPMKLQINKQKIIKEIEESSVYVNDRKMPYSAEQMEDPNNPSSDIMISNTLKEFNPDTRVLDTRTDYNEQKTVTPEDISSGRVDPYEEVLRNKNDEPEPETIPESNSTKILANLDNTNYQGYGKDYHYNSTTYGRY